MSDKTKHVLNIEKRLCKGCGICVAFCPKSVLELEEGKVKIAHPHACIECGQCEMRCPDFAIYLDQGGE